MPQRVQRTRHAGREDTMVARVRAALTLAPDAVPPRFAAAYQHGGTPTSTHLVALAAAAGTTPIWLMTGWPHTHALPATERTRP